MGNKKEDKVKAPTLYGVRVGEATMVLTEAEYDNYMKALEKEKQDKKLKSLTKE